jgi:CheY-like chemotaxis protein
VNAREACDGLEDIHAVETTLQDKRSEKPFGVIRTDCIMHVMDGDEATMKILKLAKYCRWRAAPCLKMWGEFWHVGSAKCCETRHSGTPGHCAEI